MSTQEDGLIETKELRLVDGEGRVRCKLFMDEGEPRTRPRILEDYFIAPSLESL